MSIDINEVTITGGPLPTGDLYSYSYDPITSCVYLIKKVTYPMSTSMNTSWGFIEDGVAALVYQTLAPFPPPFYDPDWYNPIDYAENTKYTVDTVDTIAELYTASSVKSSMPTMSKVIKLIGDQYALPIPW